MPNVFKEILPSILKTKKSVIHDDIDAKDYDPFIINRSLSYHVDCVSYVNEMNKYPQIDKDMQYQYYMHSIRSMKRDFQPWQKPKKDQYLKHVKDYFGYSNQKAKEALDVLTEDQLKYIVEKTTIGGTSK